MRQKQTFVVPYDFSAHARAALFAATDLARRCDAGLHLVHVIQLPAYAAYGYAGSVNPTLAGLVEIREAAVRSLRDVADGVDDDSLGQVEVHVIEGARVSDAIVESVEKLDADLIAMGTHGRTGLAHVFLGSVAERTLRSAPCPVLTVQGGSEDEPGGD